MSDSEDYKFFQLRKAAKTYISKVFSFNARNSEPVRRVWMVFEGSDEQHLGEIEGSMCLRLSGKKRKTQVTALITQDDKKVRRLSLETFKTRAGDWVETIEKNEFTFRSDEFERLLSFLEAIKFIDLSNPEKFQIQDISTKDGPKTIIDASDRGLVERFKGLAAGERSELLKKLHSALTNDDVNILLGRKQGLQEFEAQIDGNWSEVEWQDFFEREQWVFGYGLDYRIMGQFKREATVGGNGTDNRNKPVTDFLMNFTD